MNYKQYLKEELSHEEANTEVANKLKDLFKDEFPNSKISVTEIIVPKNDPDPKITAARSIYVYWTDGAPLVSVQELTDIFVADGTEQPFSQTDKMFVKRRISKPVYKQCFEYLKANNEAFKNIRIMDQAVPGFKNIYEYVDKHLENFDLSNGITEDELTILN